MIGFETAKEYRFPLVKIGDEWLAYVDCREGGADGLEELKQGLAEHAGGEVGSMIARDNPDIDLVVGLSSKKSEGYFRKVVGTVRQKSGKRGVKGMVLYADTDRQKVAAAAGENGKIVAYRPITLAPGSTKYMAIREVDKQAVREAKNLAIADDVDSTGASAAAMKLAILMERGIVVPDSVLGALGKGVIIPREIVTALESGLDINKAILVLLDRQETISVSYLSILREQTVKKRRADFLTSFYPEGQTVDERVSYRRFLAGKFYAETG